MRNLFSYFKKNESKSQPLKRSQGNISNTENTDTKQINTCPLKKSCDNIIENDQQKNNLLFLTNSILPGDILIVNSTNQLNFNSNSDLINNTFNTSICDDNNTNNFPVIVLNENLQNSQIINNENKHFYVKRYGSNESFVINYHSNQYKKIETKEELLEYYKNCKDNKIKNEYEEFIHLYKLEKEERLEMINGENEIEISMISIIETENNDISMNENLKIKNKKASFLNLDEEKKDKNIKLEKTKLLEKYTFIENKDENETMEKLEDTIKKLKSNEKKTNKIICSDENDYIHHHLEFLNDKFRKDKNGIPHYHEDSDKSTLYVPNGYINSKEVTPVMKQWWKIKSDNFDTVLLFKMGKFYETFHMDADITVKELGLLYMRGNYAHAGFPEISYPQHASALVQKGYKVARIEQVETPQMMNERNKNKSLGPSDKVIARELCSIMTPGTRIFDPFDIEININNNLNNSNIGFGLLMVIVNNSEFSHSNSENNILGVCILNTCIGKFYFSQFNDDYTFSQLRTMISSMSLPIAEIIIPKKNISSYVKSFITKSLSYARKEYINEKLNVTNVLLELGVYFGENESSNNILKHLNILQDDESIKYSLALLAIGYCIKYLKKNKIDRRIVSMKNFHKYIPNSLITKFEEKNNQKYMILDHNAITNLDILCNQDEIFNKNGSLMGLLNHCCTPFGHRLLAGLISQPLYCKNDIEERLNAIEVIMNYENKDEIRKQLKKLPDLDRLFFRIHACGDLISDENHPDNKAIIFNSTQFNKKKVNDLLNALTGFNKLIEIVNLLTPLGKLSNLIYNLLDLSQQNKCFIQTKNTVEYFQNAFNMIEAKENGIIIPKTGVIIEYDQIINDINELKNWFDIKLEQIKKQIKISNIKYWNSGKIRYYIEISESIKNLPNEFIYKSQRKGFCRYMLQELEDQVIILTQMENKRDKLLINSLGLLMKQLSSNKNHLLQSIHNISMIDCLFSFAIFSQGIYNGVMCRPLILDNNISPLIHIEQGYHPYLATITNEFISNDFILGDDHLQRTMLITGPNMGGKSTLMRQVAIIVILAQLGCYVPAINCRLTPIDRIFARLGASFDKPINGQSTFYVELLETSTLLKYATQNSLVILDELGRGTATYDGMAIAASVLEYISQNIKCLMLFSTHYHSLVRDIFSSSLNNHFKFYQMSFMLNNQENDSLISTIVFLYKLVKGVCSNSYGFHVAQLSGLSNDIIQSGKVQANNLEKTFFAKRLIEALDSDDKNISLISDLFEKIVSI